MSKSFKIAMLALALCFAGSQVVTMTAAANATPSTPILSATQTHLINGEMLRRLNINNHTLTSLTFSGKAFSIDKKVTGITTEEVKKYTSIADFQAALNANVHPAGSWALYDIEGWAETPIEDKIDPLQAMEDFADLAHANDVYVIMTPSRDLAGVDGSPCSQQVGETYNDSYLRCGLAAKAAEVGDVVEIQAQANQYDLQIFEDFAQAAIAQARNADPSKKVLVGLTTMRGDSAQQMADCWATVADDADGYWLNVQIATLDVAEDFMELTTPVS